MKCNGCGTPLGDFKLFSVVTDGHRLFVICPVCEMRVPVFTFHEHFCSEKKEEPQKEKICKTCWHWKGGTIDLRPVAPLKRTCLCPLTEGETFVNFSGHTTADDSCSRWRQDEANEV